MPKTDFPPAARHGNLVEVFDDVFMVTGTVSMPGRLPMRFSRNMVVVREGGVLTLVNSVRLSDARLEDLEALGTVEHVVRLAGFHGLDDPFYKERYGATVYSGRGMPYVRGFAADKESASPYFRADIEYDSTTASPVDGGRLILFDSCKPSEGLLLLPGQGGILLTGDSLQNWHRTDEYFSLPAKIVMRLMGFIKAHNLGPGWLKAAKPSAADVGSILDLDFENVLPAHGAAVIGNARELYRPTIESFLR